VSEDSSASLVLLALSEKNDRAYLIA